MIDEKKKILVVEDENVFAFDLKYRLENLGYNVIGIESSGKKSIKLAGELKPDIILMDIILKGELNGIEAAEQIKQEYCIPVIYITAFATNEILNKAKITEPYGYLIKPINDRELHVAIEIALYKKISDDQLARYQDNLENLVEERTKELTRTINKLKRIITKHEKTLKELKKREDELRSRNRIIEYDMKNAQIIQRALLPGAVRLYKNLIIDHRYLPLEDIGGDYFSFTPLKEGGFGIFLGDVASHGVSAALFLSLVKFATNNSCRLHGQAPGKFLEKLNNDLVGNMPSSFLTAIYVFFGEKDSNNITPLLVSNAGHQSPILYKKEKDEIIQITERNFIIGIKKEEKYNDLRLDLSPGDRIFFYTDGLTEAMNSRRKMLDTQGLIELININRKRKLGNAMDEILTGVEKFKGKAKFKDDIVIIGVEVT